MSEWKDYVDNNQGDNHSADSSGQNDSSQQNGTYSYGRYGQAPVPPSTQSGGYYASGYSAGAQEDPSQNGYAANGAYASNQTTPAGYDANGAYSNYPPGYGYAAQTPPPKPPKKPRTGLAIVLTAICTAAVLLLVYFGVGALQTMQTPIDSSSGSQSSSSQSGGASGEGSSQSSQPDYAGENGGEAFDILPSGADGELTPKQVVAKVKPSVVCIENFQGAQMVQAAGEGSGIIMDAEGYIITNQHVVEGATSLKVVLYDGTTVDATLVGSDTTTDLAVIKIDPDGLNLQPAEFGDSTALEQGDFVMCVGNPGGLAFSSSSTFGTVSAVDRPLATTDSGYIMHYIQTDAAVNPGNSGGPLVNMQGQVVGITSSKVVAQGFEGLSFAISIDEAKPVISDLKNYGYVTGRPFLGIKYQFVNEQISMMYNLPVGIYIGEFTTDTMTSAGCEVGDVLTHADGTPLTSASVLTNLLLSKQIGDTMEFTVYRASTNQTFTVTVTLQGQQA